MDTTVSLSAPALAWTLSFAAVAAGAFVNACLSYFLHHSFRPGHVLHAYRQWLDRRLADNHWRKPLGGCVVCMNVWLALPGFAALAAAVPLAADAALLYWWPAYALASNFFLRKMLQSEWYAESA